MNTLSHQTRILFVEDDPSDAELIERALRRGLSFVTHRVETRESLLQALDTFRPDVVLTDYTLPGFNGFDVLKLVRQKSADLPVILVTGALSDSEALDLITAGANDYVLKDRPARLCFSVQRALYQLHLMQQREKSEQALRASEAALHQSMKMEALGQLCGGVAHDFNNMLAVIRTNAEDLAEDLKDTAHSDQVEMILHAAIRGGETVARLMAFSRKQELKPETIDLNARLDPFALMLHRTVPENIVIKVVKDVSLPLITIDPARLENALLNLVINARDAMPAGGSITIQTRAKDLTIDDVSGLEGMTAGPHAMISVTDTGTGIPPELLSRIFDPFFTTKEIGKGTGLGLSMVFGFAKQCGGNATVESKPGQGTTITLLLPIVAKDVRSDGEGLVVKLEKRNAESAASGQRAAPLLRKILVVEDNDLVRRSVTAKLQRLGLTVTTADSAQDALDILEHSADFDFVLSDVIMPGEKSGADLVREIRTRWPSIRPLLTSGYTESNLLGKIDMPADVRVLPKPYSNADLEEAIGELMTNCAVTI